MSPPQREAQRIEQQPKESARSRADILGLADGASGAKAPCSVDALKLESCSARQASGMQPFRDATSRREAFQDFPWLAPFARAKVVKFARRTAFREGASKVPWEVRAGTA